MKRFAAAFLAAALTAGCATFERGRTQEVVIESDPPGAIVETERCDVKETGLHTPVTLSIPRRVERCTVHVLYEGYVPARIFLERGPAEKVPTAEPIFGTLCGGDLSDCNSLTDVVVMGTLGSILYGISKGVDAASGANYQLEPSYVMVVLQPDERPAAASNEDPQLP